MGRRATVAFGAALAVLVLAAVALQTGIWIDFLPTGEYEETTVTVVDENGTELGAVDARVADTTPKRIVGLSRTDELGPDEGMLFVHDEAGEHTYVMRDMAFPLDIVFADANGTVTEIHHASAPAEGAGENDLRQYTGRGKYVLEVRRGWTNRTGAEVGDQVRSPVID